MSRGFRNTVAFGFGILLAVAAALWMDGAQAQQAGAVGVGQAGASALIVNEGGTHNYEAMDAGDRVPDVVAPSYPTAYNCAKGWGAAGGLSGGGLSFGGHTESEECNVRADSAHAAKLGDFVTSRELMCSKFRYYAGNMRAQKQYASLGMPFVSTNKAHPGFPLACFPNAEFDAKLGAQVEKDKQIAAEYKAGTHTSQQDWDASWRDN